MPGVSSGRCELKWFSTGFRDWKKTLTLRLWVKKHKKPCVQYACTHTHIDTHFHTHTLHNLCTHFNQCLNPPVYVATVTTPTLLLVVSRVESSRHTFLWFLGWKRFSQFISLGMDVLTSAPLCRSQWAALLCKTSGNYEKCRHTLVAHMVGFKPLGYRWILPLLMCAHGKKPCLSPKCDISLKLYTE